jgi:hypothetical protein
MAHKIIFGEFDAKKRLNLKYALTLLPSKSSGDKYFKTHVFFLCYFVS